MEKVIDRKEYRRNVEREKIIEDDQIDIIQKKIKKILLQSLGVSIILLIISILKFYNNKDILMKLEYAINDQITISSLQKNGQRIFNLANDYYMQIDSLVKKVLNDNNANISITPLVGKNNVISGEKVIESNLVINNLSINKVVSGDNLTESGDEKFEKAVEGINQMSDDAKYIKEHYQIMVPVIGTITSKFGVRNSTNPTVSRYHSGLDIAANTGTQVVAALDGEVLEATTDTYYGKYLKVKKDDIIMIYAHCSKLLVKAGDKIKKGSLIAYVGNTGNSTGPHLHFELKYQDRLVDPSDVLEI